MSIIQLNRSKTGVAPTVLADGELYVDQLNNKLYWADATGVVHSMFLTVQPVVATQMPALTGDVTSAAGAVATTIAAGAVTLAKIAAAAVATTANYLANVAGTLLTSDQAWGAVAFVTLTDAATIVVDMSTFLNAKVTLAGNRTLGAPSNTKPGQAGSILITQDATGSRTLAYNAVWKFAGGSAPTASTAANTVDRLDYLVVDSTHIHAALTRGVA
jgi:hypothetical protein